MRPIFLLNILQLGILPVIDAAHGSISEDIATNTEEIDWATVTPKAHAGHKHGRPILDDPSLTPQQIKYWKSYNTTTYFTVETSAKPQLWIHFAFLIFSFVFLYPFVMIFNNLDSNWYLPALTAQGLATIVSIISYSIFIRNVPDLFPGMGYSKMVVGLFVMTIIQYTSAIIYVGRRWIEGGPRFPAAAHYVSVIPSPKQAQDKNIELSELEETRQSQLNDITSPSSTLYDHDNDAFQIDEEQRQQSGTDTVGSETLGTSNNNNPDSIYIFGSNRGDGKEKSAIADRRDSILNQVFEYPGVAKCVRLFGFIATVIFKILNFGMMFYFLVMLPTGIAGLNLMGREKHVFNLLAHFIKGGVFFTLGLFSLARYLGAYSRIGGAWNYSYVTEDDKRHSLWLRLQPKGSMITFEMIESCLILLYGSTNIFLEHLAAAGEPWAAKDLQHVSIAFMYIGAGLCGVITEVQLTKWRRTKFFDQVGNTIDRHTVQNVTPGFSPNPFLVFTIFWTGLLMSQHAQASVLSTKVHVQWGSLLTYGSFFRAITFILMSYYPLKDKSACFKPGRPMTELVTSFCLLCGGLVFMESTDQVIEAMEYRGLTPMFTLNVSVGCTALIMAWIMVIFSFKNWLHRKMYGESE